jgi:hypothetical protein
VAAPGSPFSRVIVASEAFPFPFPFVCPACLASLSLSITKTQLFSRLASKLSGIRWMKSQHGQVMAVVGAEIEQAKWEIDDKFSVIKNMKLKGLPYLGTLANYFQQHDSAKFGTGKSMARCDRTSQAQARWILRT